MMKETIQGVANTAGAMIQSDRVNLSLSAFLQVRVIIKPNTNSFATSAVANNKFTFLFSAVLQSVITSLRLLEKSITAFGVFEEAASLMFNAEGNPAGRRQRR